MHNRNMYVKVPCGKCVPCLKRRASHWSFRLNEQAKISSSSAFLTLTYENAPLTTNGLQTLKKKDFQNFFKRLRKYCPTNKLKYYACGEYGSRTQRPHYHAIILNLPHSMLNKPEIITNIWGHGHTQIYHSNQVTINYVVGYMIKGNIPKNDERSPEFSLMSKKMGLNYLTPKMIKYYHSRQLSAIVKEGGTIMSMPRYYKEKIFTKEELRKINKEYELINKLNFLELDNHYTEEYEKRKSIIRQHLKSLNLKRQLI